MHRELFEERVMAAPRNADPRMACEMISKRLTDMACGTGILLVVEADGRIVAEGTLQRSNGDGSITLGLLVLKAFRDRGIGRCLMVALEDEARRLGKRRVDLTVWGVNDRAYHLYTSMGYREMGRFPDWNRSDLAPGGLSDHVWMIKDL
jgi:GNAT superfamily N-acetyltransferase